MRSRMPEYLHLCAITEASQWLEKPRLIEIKAVVVDKRRLNEFSMDASLKRDMSKEAGKK